MPSAGFLSGLFASRKREAPNNNNKDDDSTSKKKTKSSSPVKKRTGGSKIDFGNAWSPDDSDDDSVSIIQAPPRPFVTKKRLAPTKITGKEAAAALVKNASFDDDTSSDDSDDDANMLSKSLVHNKNKAEAKNGTPSTACDSEDGDIFQESTQPTSNVSSTKMRARSESDEEDTESLSDQVNDTLPTTEQLQSQCWKCSAQLSLPQEFCLYAMHTHPLLKVPICCVCADQVLAVEQQLVTTANKEEATECSGCGRDQDDVEALLLCDECPRGFCDTCVACAHGGGTEGRNAATLLQESDAKWSCPCCQPPTPLQTLQAHMERVAVSKEQQDTKPRTTEDIALELYKVELERKECEQVQSPQVVEQKRAEFRAELLQSMASCPMEDIDEAVEQDLEEWKQMWADHDVRLLDRAAPLQEEIELRGENLAGCYAAILGESNANDGIEPEWKKAADDELQRREEEEDEDDSLPLRNPSDPFIYKKDIPEDVEDLGSSDSIVTPPMKKSQWRHNKRRATEEDLQEALHHEEEMMQQRNIAVSRIVNDNEDIEETKEEEELASGRAADGTSRIRRDVYQVVMSQREQRSRPTKRRRVSPPSSTRPGIRATRNDQMDRNEINSDDDGHQQPASTGDGVFGNSSVVLSRASEDSTRSIRTIAIAAPLAGLLKSHQVDGIRFMWRNCFSDLSFVDATENDSESVGGCILAHNMGLGKSLTYISLLHALLNHPSLVSSDSDNGGTPHRGLVRSMNQPLIHTALLVVPTNVLSHWEEEFENWVGHLSPSLTVFNLAVVSKESRLRTVRSWTKKGGILLVSKDMFVQLVKVDAIREALQGADIVCADEAHSMLTKTTNKIFHALSGVRTKRRIALTGSPIQNNLLEYFRMVSWVRPGVLGSSEADFDNEYANPIMTGLASDASAFAVRTSNEASRELHKKLAPYVQRKDAKVLRKDLPPMQQVILHVRQSKAQVHLYRAFKRYKASVGITNFFVSYQMTRPIHNHPATLLISSESGESKPKDRPKTESPAAARKPSPEDVVRDDEIDTSSIASSSGKAPATLEIVELSGDSETEIECETVKAAVSTESKDANAATDEEANDTDTASLASTTPLTAQSSSLPPSGRAKAGGNKEEWWRTTVERHGGADKLKEVEQGYKVVLLLHILMEAQAIGDKVLVFAQCLKTLDFIEYVLGLEDWAEHVPSLSSSSPGAKRGGWKKNVDYLRIDGQTQFSERGDLIARFNDEKASSNQEQLAGSSSGQLKVFLLSAKACGIGINLIGANRVVLFDSHFNPTILTQSLYRCYRYGQTKPVFAYRFLTEGSVEEKVYSRCVNKAGVALRVIDNKSITRSFTDKELRDLEETDAWVQCDSCEKWRMLPANCDSEALPEKWFCFMNTHDSVNNSCDASEKDARWYYRHLSEQLDILKESPVKCMAREEVDSALSPEEKAKLLDNDAILKKLLKVTAREQQSSIISKYYFHEALLAETEEEDVPADEAVVERLASAEQERQEEPIVKAPQKTSGKEMQPSRAGLIKAVDIAHANADKNKVTIGAVLRGLEDSYGVKFEKETKTIVRSRLKVLIVKDSAEPRKPASATIEEEPKKLASATSEEEESKMSASKPPFAGQANVSPSAAAACEEAEGESKLSHRQEYFSTAEKSPSKKVAITNVAVSSSSPHRSRCESVGGVMPTAAEPHSPSQTADDLPTSARRPSPSAEALCTSPNAAKKRSRARKSARQEAGSSSKEESDSESKLPAQPQRQPKKTEEVIDLSSIPSPRSDPEVIDLLDS